MSSLQNLLETMQNHLPIVHMLYYVMRVKSVQSLAISLITMLKVIKMI